MKPVQICAPEFDLEKTLNSGQVFHWEKSGTGYIGTIGERPAYVEQQGDKLCVKVASASSRCFEEHEQDAHATIARYFALDHPLGEICASLPNDAAMKAAREFCCGLRIIRQPKWECLAMFICSSMKQVAHIRQIGAKLRQRFGEPRVIIDGTVFTFPSAERIAQSSEEELRACALGYRARNLFATAGLVAAGRIDLEALAGLPDLDLQRTLCELPGVGAKVANCVMLFAYERLRAFPIDVWIERVLKQRYFAGKRKVTPRHLREFAASYFGEHGGYAQQYLFHYARMNKPPGRTGPLNQKNGTRPASARALRLGRRRVSLHDKKRRVT
jgi:N-glycosylase/DNA lyase